jgi:segregation and condensation protein A
LEQEPIAQEPAPLQPQTDPGIDLLVTLAKNGEIDPWDIDIVVVTDKYLQALDQLAHRTLEASGKGLFYACVLLHMKARILSAAYMPPPEPSSDDMTDDMFGFEGAIGEDDIGPDIEWAQIVSTDKGVLLVPRGRPRSRPITLDDLIRALKGCDSAERMRRDRGLPPTASFFVNSTNQDDVAGDIEVVRRLMVKLSSGQGVEFRKLVGDGISAGGAFLALLFMAAREEVSLTQKDFYLDLSITTREVK